VTWGLVGTNKIAAAHMIGAMGLNGVKPLAVAEPVETAAAAVNYRS
jgi:predicted dehydrogenase